MTPANKLKSKRADGLGHWPAGRRRNPDAVIGGRSVDDVCAAALFLRPPASRSRGGFFPRRSAALGN